MNFLIAIFFLLIKIWVVIAQRILPFSRIKMINEDIYFTLKLNDAKDIIPHESTIWHKLLSLESVGSDALVKFSKETYGHSKCDFKIKCYKYNLIVNFDKVFNLKNNLNTFPKTVSIEYELEGHIQSGIDVVSNYQKFDNNLKFIEDNINLTLEKNNSVEKLLSFSSKLLFRGINKLKKNVIGYFSNNNKNTNEAIVINKNLTIHNNQDEKVKLVKTSLNKIHSDNSYKIQEGENNLRKEFKELKEELKKIENEEKIIEKNLKKDIQKINLNLNKERSIIENMWKREIIAGLIGSLIVFGGFAIYYLCNGLVKEKMNKKSIN